MFYTASGFIYGGGADEGCALALINTFSPFLHLSDFGNTHTSTAKPSLMH